MGWISIGIILPPTFYGWSGLWRVSARLRTGQPYTLHADLVGARNIAMRTLLTRQDWVRTGVLSVRPDVSDHETKAAHLKRYADLRWSSDTSPSL